MYTIVGLGGKDNIWGMILFYCRFILVGHHGNTFFLYYHDMPYFVSNMGYSYMS